MMTETPYAWMWTLLSGLLVVAVALVAFFLPEIEWLPKGGIVGWLLLAAGSLDLVLAAGRRRGRVKLAAATSGLLTFAAGAIFVLEPLARFLAVTNLVILWLIVRGGLVALIALNSSRPARWFAFSGAIDALLALVLLAGLPVAAFIYALFGPTPELVARFSLVLALSFLTDGAIQIAIGLHERHLARQEVAHG